MAESLRRYSSSSLRSRPLLVSTIVADLVGIYYFARACGVVVYAPNVPSRWRMASMYGRDGRLQVQHDTRRSGVQCIY